MLIVAALAPPAPATDAAALSNEGSTWLKQGNVKRALPLLEKAAALAPANPHIQFNYGLALSRAGRLREALKPLGTAAAEPSLAGEARFLRGAAYFEMRSLEEATTELQRVRSDPRFSEPALYMLVESHRRLGNAKESQAAFVDLIGRHPDSAYAHKLLGIAYESQRRFDEAIAEFQASLRANPDMPELRFAVGFTYWKKLDFEAARRWLAEELERNACYAAAHFYLADIAGREGSLKEALGHLQATLSCDPKHLDALLARGRVLERQGDLDGAIASYRVASQAHPTNVAGHYRLALALRAAGRRQQADAEFAVVRKLQAGKQEKAKLDSPQAGRLRDILQ